MANKSIQKALAVLVTNLHFSENYMDFREKIIAELSLDESDANALDIFYEDNKSKFTASSRILKKNRWDDIKSSLPIIVNNIDNKILDALWECYLSKHKLTDNIPKNPLAESILFTEFSEKSPLLSFVTQQLFKYERIRNTVTYKHNETFIKHPVTKDHDVNEANMMNFSIYIHECYRIEAFECDIPKIINKLKNDDASTIVNCVILFFKSLNKEGIGTLKISSDAKDLIDRVKISNNLCEIYDCFQQKLTESEFLQFFKNLKKIGVLSFHKQEEIK